MPSGHTHDRITWGCFPFITMGGYAITHSWSIAIASGASFLFSGFMFGPDLDIHSKQYRRWGWLRWIWRPYQDYVPHRSWLSHGPMVGTILRLFYLGIWVGLGLAIMAIAQELPWHHYLRTPNTYTIWPIEYKQETIAAFVGLEIGAFSHYASDWISSTIKKFRLFK